ncbi:MAG: hypothetical protein ACR2RF_25075 [Geminicoccaceae bacterium]
MARNYALASTDHIDTGTWDFPASTTQIFLSAWVRLETLSATNDYRFISKASGTAESQHRWMLGHTGTDEVRARLWTSGPAAVTTLVSTSAPFSGRTDEWLHVCLRYDDALTNEMELFVAGTSEAATALAGGSVSTGDGSDVWVGGNPGSSTSSPDGDLAHAVVISGVSFTDEEIAAMATGVSPLRFMRTGSTELFMPVLGAATEPDYSGNGRNGTVTGTSVSDNPPVAPLFGFDEPYGAFVAAGGGGTLIADSGSYAWTGQTANLLYNSLLSAESGSYAWTGQVANLEYHPVLSAEAASYAWSGQTANLLYNALISAESGSYAWAGQDATLTHVTGSVLTAESGAYVWSGMDVGLLLDSVLSAEAGSYVWAGQDASLEYSASSIWTPKTQASTNWTEKSGATSTWTPKGKPSTTWTEE